MSRNKVIKKAKVKYIAFLDSDDLWHNNKLKLQINFMHNNNVQFSFTSYKKSFSNYNHEVVVNAPKQIRYNDLLHSCIIGCSTVIYDTEIIGFDKTSDLALLKLEGSNFPYAKLGDSDELIIGEWVIALGNPFELFTISNNPSASVGIVSALNMDFGMQKSGKVLQNMIQTDAAINPGNSGGPLINANGEVIGINTFIFTDYEHFRGSVGIGFAIPINVARRIAEELRINGEIDRGYSTGLIVKSVTRSISRYLNLPEAIGVIIVDIAENSEAKKAGLFPGDVIIKVNDQNINKPGDVRKVILENDLRSGDRLNIKIFRGGIPKNIKMKLGKYIK